MRLRFAGDGEADALRNATGLWPDRHCASSPPGGGIGSRSRAGGKHHDIAARRLRSEQTGAVESDEVRTELVDRPPTRALGRSEEHASRGSWKLMEEPVLRRDSRDERGLEPVLAQPLGGPGTDGCELREVAAAAHELIRTVGTCHDHPLVPRPVDRLVGCSLDRNQRTLDYLVPMLLEPLHERSGLRARTGNDHLHPQPPGGDT